jgi:hypothetical protein
MSSRDVNPKNASITKPSLEKHTMLRSRLLPWLFTAGLFLAAACGDSVSPTTDRAAAAPTSSPVNLITLTGSIRLTGEKLYPVVLSTSTGFEIPLTGENANILMSVENAGVEVHGRWDPEGGDGFFVSDFLVETMGGNAVIDGTLVAVYSTPTDIDGDPIAYAIRPTLGGSDVNLSDPSADLVAHLNQRLWVAGVDASGGTPTAYGVIKEM